MRDGKQKIARYAENCDSNVTRSRLDGDDYYLHSKSGEIAELSAK